jgi:hypothetical protein
VDRSALIVSVALMGLLIVEFVWLELRARRKNRKAGGREGPVPSTHHDPRGNGEGGRH